jgi:hypothetical protein
MDLASLKFSLDADDIDIRGLDQFVGVLVSVQMIMMYVANRVPSPTVNAGRDKHPNPRNLLVHLVLG